MANSPAVVAALARAPVKGLRLARCEQLELTPEGVAGDRRFYLIDERGRMVNGKASGKLQQVSAVLDGSRLTLGLPGGPEVSAEVELGERVPTAFFSSSREARLVQGPFSAALSAHVGAPLRLVEPADRGNATDRGSARAAVSLLSRGSLARLAQVAGEPSVDGRRFRMNIEVAEAEPFEEDSWLGREVTIGAARVLFHGHVGRCLVTRRDPETGEIDLGTLELLQSIRADARTTEPLALGVYGSVLEPGLVRVGDAIQL